MATIAQIEIDTAALNRDTNSLNSTLGRIKSEITGMYEAVRTMDGMWDGPANEAFNTQFRVDHNNMNSICNAVQSLIRSMENASRKYVAGENQVNAVISSIRI